MVGSPSRSPALPIARLSAASLACLALTWLSPAERALAVTPESPEVKQLVDKGVQFLEQPLSQQYANSMYGWNTMPGAKALVGMAMIKAGRGVEHPRVIEAVTAIQATYAQNAARMDVYNTGIAMIFLFELDPQRYRGDMERLLGQLLSVQKGHGGWGYPERPTGDTSMTQYGVLGLWAAEQAGIPTPVDSWDRVTNWLLRTQAPAGAWGYQGVDPGTFQRTNQTEVRLSLAVAGLGSLYISGDHLRLFESNDFAGLPAELKPRARKGSGGPLSANVDIKLAAAARGQGNDWFQSNYTISPPEWVHYYLYALERYQSFRDLAAREASSNASWYDEGVSYLSGSQQADGSWRGPPGEHTVADTAFSILFLTRSTRKSIQRARSFGAGTLTGGRGLPTEAGGVRMQNGGLRAKPLLGPAEQLLKVMEDPSNPEFQAAIEGLDSLTLEGEEEQLSETAKRLRALTAASSPDARAAALKALAKTRNMDEAPILIEALKDPDAQVFRAAYDGLRFMSRKFVGLGYSGGADDATREAAVKQWKAWYRSIRPTAALED